MTKVFIDGSQGTTGLKIFDRLSKRTDIELHVLTGDDRKDPEARKKALNEADIAFLCLPDAAATEAVEWVENDRTVILDTSTAHRTSPGWAYGFPELSDAAFQNVKNGKRIAVPGCHASGFIALIEPLVQNGFLKPETYLSCTSLTGYSGGGKKMIAQYETETDNPLLKAPRVYGLSQQHKHLKEMVAVTGLKTAPAFCPIVAPFYSGMLVTVVLDARELQNGKTADDIKTLYRSLYNTSIVSYAHAPDEEGFLSAAKLSSLDRMEIAVFGNSERILLAARYDNLGKGASGAALECMNIVMGLDPDYGLEL